MNILADYLIKAGDRERCYCHDIRDVCASGNIQRLLEFSREEIEEDKEELLYTAYKYAHINIAGILLEEYKTDFIHGFAGACDGCHIEMAKVLLNDPRLDRTDEIFDEVFDGACRMGHTEIVILLLPYQHSIYINSGFCEACRGNSIEVIKLLLLDSRPKDIYMGLLIARNNNHTEVINLIEEHMTRH